MTRVHLITLIAASLAVTSTASAGVLFEEVQTTAVAIPMGVNPGGIFAVSAEGQVVMISGSQDGTHLFPLTLGQGSDSEIVYNFQDIPVGANSFAFGPGGDLLLRGTVTPEMDDPFGITVRIDLEGSVVWEQPDMAFSDTEDFIGRYVGPAGPINWSPTAQRVLIFTEASFEVAPVSQGSMLFEFNGDVRVPSILFGDEFIGSALNNALVTPDGKFLVYYFSLNDRGTRFFLFDGLESVSFFEPEGGDWTQREVINVDYDPNGNLILMWVDLADSGDGAKANLTKLDPDGKLLWETDLAGAIDVQVTDQDTGEITTENIQMSRPFFMVAAAEETVLIRQAGPSFVFDVRSSEDGSPLGFFDFFQLTENSVFDFVFLNGSEREYLLSTVNNDDPNNNQVLQVKLVLNDDPVIIDDMNNMMVPDNNMMTPDNNGPLVDPDMEEPVERPDIPEVGCCATVPTRPAPFPWTVSLVLLGLCAVMARRR